MQERQQKREKRQGRGELGRQRTGAGVPECGKGEAGRGRKSPLLDGCPGPLPIPPVCTCLPCIDAIHLVIQQIFIEPLLWTRPWSRSGDTALNGADKAPSLMELTFWCGRLMSQHIEEQRVQKLLTLVLHICRLTHFTVTPRLRLACGRGSQKSRPFPGLEPPLL